MTTKERLHQLVEELPEERAGEWLRRIETEETTTEEILATQRERLAHGGAKGSPVSSLSTHEVFLEDPANGGFSEEFLSTFGSWGDDPRTTEEIMEEIRSARTPNREITL